LTFGTFLRSTLVSLFPIFRFSPPLTVISSPYIGEVTLVHLLECRTVFLPSDPSSSSYLTFFSLAVLFSTRMVLPTPPYLSFVPFFHVPFQPRTLSICAFNPHSRSLFFFFFLPSPHATKDSSFPFSPFPIKIRPRWISSFHGPMKAPPSFPSTLEQPGLTSGHNLTPSLTDVYFSPFLVPFHGEVKDSP